MKEFYVPWPVQTDAYQSGHFLQIPPGMEDFQLSAATFRKPLHYFGDLGTDYRIISAGAAPFLQLEMSAHISEKGIASGEDFLSHYHATLPSEGRPDKPYPFNKEMFERIAKEFAGRIPVCIMGLPDGHAHYVGEPCMQVWTDVPGMGECVGLLEAISLPYLWSSSAVATRGRMRKQWFLETFRKYHPGMKDDDYLLESRFIDFGLRGAAAAQITGIAHLINWLGTDNFPAAYAAQTYLNRGKPFGANSIVASAHRSVTPWNREVQAIHNMIERCKGGIFAFVADSYDYKRCMHMLGSNAEAIQLAGGHLVGRPDSGNPVDMIILGLQVFAKYFPVGIVDGLKVLQGASLIYADGVSDRAIFKEIYPAVVQAGFSPLNLVFGMGEYNHRAVRSDLELASKTSVVGHYDYGLADAVDMHYWSLSSTRNEQVLTYHNVMKKGESRFKLSIPGPVAFRADNTKNRIMPITVEQLKRGEIGDYVVLYDGRPNPLPVYSYTFDDTRALAERTWNALVPNPGDTLSGEIRIMQEEYLQQINEQA